jgi:hypothetical protein
MIKFLQKLTVVCVKSVKLAKMILLCILGQFVFFEGPVVRVGLDEAGDRDEDHDADVEDREDVVEPGANAMTFLKIRLFYLKFWQKKNVT